MTDTAAQRYTTVAIILHWVMAAAFVLMLASGLSMEYLELQKSFKFNLYQWHKSLGVLLLAAFALRLFWRLLHKPPALPASIKGLEAVAAKAGHIALYLCMLAVPLSGWAMVSSSNYGLPTIVFGLFEWPHIPKIAGNEAVNAAAKTAHWALAWLFIAAILGHVAAVVKHAAIDRENLLPRMWFSCARCKKSKPE
ncbi:MAG TPA: cytochrome b [Alphaproteobacteria bacterium]|nr:cytochrome b [Alphaproteobacteria bacterium]